MASPELNAEVLLHLGFVDVGKWHPNGDVIDYQLDGENASANEPLLYANNALYAFVEGDQVRYIGKTARSIRKRYVGYCRPGKKQATNQRCHSKIRNALAEGNEIRIFAFAPITHLRYAEFEINLAAGLEDDLIRQFDPPWNGKDKRGQEKISEDAEREEAEEAQVENPDLAAASDLQPEPRASDQATTTFPVVLGPTYFYKGFLNPGVEASEFLGKDGDPIRVLLGDASVAVVSKINRTANRTGAVRVVGGNSQIAQWFQENFNEGDTVQGRVLDQHTILLLPF
jgi:hypothetical protein